MLNPLPRTSASFFQLILRASLFLAAALLTLSNAAIADEAAAPPLPPSQVFGKTAQGEPVTLYTLTNKSGMSVSIMDYGATIVKIIAPDRTGKLDDVVLGFDHFAPYLTQSACFGATVGRYANRIAGGKFELGGVNYQLPLNEGPNTLHGGPLGFNKRMWKAEPVESNIPALRFSRLSPDGEEGFPGNLFVSVTFSLTDDNRLRIAYQATTDKATIINLTNHTYFNLAGHGTILDQVLTLHARAFTPTDASHIPTGEIKDVAGTPWDFINPTAIGAHLQDAGGKPPGYDHNFVLDKGFFSKMAVAAEVEDPKSGRTLEISTDQPGVQFYTGNYLDGKPFPPYGGFALETQHFADSPHHDNFPSTVLGAGETFKTATVYAFGVK